MHFPTEDIKDTAWKWRCKLASIGKSDEKTVADFSSDSSSLEKPKITAKKSLAAASAASGSKDPDFGAAASVKTLYEGKNSTDKTYRLAGLSSQTARAPQKSKIESPIKVFKVKDKEKPVISGRYSLKYHRIDVQNPLLVAALEPIVKKEDVHLDAAETAVFEAPFRPLYFGYDEIVAKYRSLEDDDPLKPFIHLFIKVLDDVFSEVRAKRRQLAKNDLICFKHAWTYFPRGSVAVSHGSNCDILTKVVSTSYVKDAMCCVRLVVLCKVLRFNGDAFIWEEEKLEVPEFGGNKPVTELPHYPLQFHKDAESLMAKMKARGRMVLDYQGLAYCTYSGVALFEEGKKCEKHNVDGRILIDVIGYNKYHLTQGPREGQDPASVKNMVKGTGRKPTAATTATKLKAATGNPQKPSGTHRLNKEEQHHNTEAMLRAPEDLMFMYPLVEGFALKNKLWLSFYVEDIRPMEWNDQAFDHLVYDEQQKDLVLSFVESHSHTRPRVGDVIMGKGDGLIILLSGPPGTGKTLTAEAVADRTHRPLFYLQAEDLGINAAALGANVKKVFQMATEWDAVILLDEADVFMANRHPQDIARNELVSIFLRELEYFRGIIFLTTNLFDTIDSAFRSRVSLHLLFKPLGADARLAVWRKFLDRLPKPATKALKDGEPAGWAGDGKGEELVEEDLKELSAWNLNGREIKTAVKMVRSWCDHKGYVMNLARLENGIKVTSPHVAKMTNADDTDLYD